MTEKEKAEAMLKEVSQFLQQLRPMLPRNADEVRAMRQAHKEKMREAHKEKVMPYGGLEEYLENARFELVRAARELLTHTTDEQQAAVLRVVLANFDPPPQNEAEEKDIGF